MVECEEKMRLSFSFLSFFLSWKWSGFDSDFEDEERRGKKEEDKL